MNEFEMDREIAEYLNKYSGVMVYVASPYTKGDNFVNVQRQIEVGNKLIDFGIIPYLPLVGSAYLHAQKERHFSEWLGMDFNIIMKCDAILRLSGESSGADMEERFANTIKKPVFYTVEAVVKYFVKEGNE